VTTRFKNNTAEANPESPVSAMSVQLPSPQDLPDAEVVIYDGHCSFCKKQVANLYRWDGRGRLAFVSLHDAFVKQNYRDLSHDKMMEQMYLITNDNRRLAGANAFRYITTRLPRLWILAPLLHIPFSLPLWQFLYMQVAKQRYRIAGKTAEVCEGDTCHVHFGGKK